MIRNLLALARSIAAHKRGNVLMIFAFAVIPMVFATGMGIDYARAARLRTKLNAIADAAALAAVAQPQMNDPSDDDATAVAQKMFDAQADDLEGLDGTPKVTIGITHPNGATSRVATVSYTANSINAFGGVLRMRTIPIGGTSSATATAAPNMDFYIALDTSPSMALPTTSAGITTLDNAVKCSFACHSNKIQVYAGGSTMPNGLILDNASYSIIKGSYGTIGSGASQKQIIDGNGAYIYTNRTTYNSSGINSRCVSNKKDICVYNADGTFVDTYWYALNQGIPLRVTDERNAIKDLMSLAQNYADINKRIYRAGVYTFDYDQDFKTIQAMPALGQPSNLSAVSAAAGSIDLVTVNDKQGNGCPPAPITCSTSTNTYRSSSFKSMLDNMGNALPAKSGQGSNEPGDTPQAYLFLVTDGMSDEYTTLNSDRRTRSSMLQAQVDQCTAIKARGIKIAILYTEYTTDSIADDKGPDPTQWQLAYNAITQSPTIAERLTQCASPGLMYTVKTDQSISQALQALFAKAIANARLNQ